MPVISRAFVEIGAKTDQLLAGFEEAIKAAEKFGGELSKEGKRMIQNFDNALNPTKTLATHIGDLERAGRSAADIQRVLGDRIKSASEQAIKNGQAIDPLVAKYYNAEGAFAKFGQTIGDIVQHPMQAMQKGIANLIGDLGPTGMGIMGLATAAGAAGLAFIKMGVGAAENMERLDNLSKITGLTTQEIEILEEISRRLGLENLNLSRSFGQLNAELGEGKGGFIDGLKALDISYKDLATGKTKDLIVIFDEIRAKLLAVSDAGKRAELANQAFSGRLREMIPLLLNAEGDLSELFERFKEFATDEKTKQGLLDLDSRVDSLTGYIKSLAKEVNQFAGKAIANFLESMEIYGAAVSRTGTILQNKTKVTKDAKTETDNLGKAVKSTSQYIAFSDDIINDWIQDAGKKYVKQVKEMKEESERLKRVHSELAVAIDNELNQSLEDLIKYTKSVVDETDNLINVQEHLEENVLDMDRALDKVVEGLSDYEQGIKDVVDVSKSMEGIAGALDAQVEAEAEVLIAAGENLKRFRDDVDSVFDSIAGRLADNIVEWGSWKDLLIGILKDFAKVILTYVIGQLIDPILSALKRLMEWVVTSLANIFSFTSMAGGIIGQGMGGLGGWGGIGGGFTGSSGIGFSRGPWDLGFPAYPGMNFASGTDYVPRTGLAMLHQGEAVIPANENRQITVIIEGPIYGMDDLDSKIAESYYRLQRRGAIA